MSLLRTICSLTQRSLRGKYNVYSNIEFNGRRVMSSSGSFLFYRKTISRIVSPPVLHGIVAMRSLSYEVPIADITVVDVEKTCQKVPMEDLKKTYPDRTVIINDVDDLFLSAACGDKLREEHIL
ncbi:hypothetical protein KP509_05G083900 [Ceratopteris richardii]|uniref:Uncharacterized protein n=1 Tax=Ceratopteris richardii TaxID=49495 RepID=A0A8T2USR8_CERRI|nr:hypothetical protein KP509_05G083900 [Ceratopteris richardii]